MPIHLRCPLCTDELNRVERTLKCANNHCFDLAKEGYVNLLPVQNKNSKAPGDNAAMVQARRRFLEQGYYDSFVQALTETMMSFQRFQSNTSALLDIGCGEGYYLSTLSERFGIIESHGIDISKAAVKLCAKKLKQSQCSVASAYSLPYFNESFDTAVSVFSPIQFDEAFRILKPNGYLYFVGPGPKHLCELASLIYNKAINHEGNKQSASLSSDTFLSSHAHRATISVSGEHINDLLQMTPYYWSCSEQAKTRLNELEELSLSLDFEIHVFKKQGTADDKASPHQA